MRPFHGLLIGLVAIVVAVAVANIPMAGTGISPSGGPQAARSEAAPDTRTAWTGGAENAHRHWLKHGGRFPQFGSEQDYVAGVHAFLAHPPSGTLIKHRANGDTLYFDPASGVFAVQAENGAPRTFFKPDDGMAYWERQ